MTKAILFDCFGVLLTDALSVIVEELRKQDPTTAEQIVALVILENRGVLSMQDFTEQAAAMLGITPDELRSKVVNGEVKNKELFDYILELRKTYQTGILSNVSSEGFWRRFSYEELVPYFDDVILSAEIGYAKPDPKAYKIAAERLGTPPGECLLIDDREDYLAGARATGMQGILYESVSGLQEKMKTFVPKAPE